MPTYDYDCEVCGNVFELFQSMSEPPADKCPNCGGAVKRRIHGGVGLIFKGSGFYLTDYKKAAKSSSEDKTEAGGGKAKTDAKTEKPAGEKTSSKSPGEAAKKSSESSKANE